jgi:non-heme chloroperoxidase
MNRRSLIARGSALATGTAAMTMLPQAPAATQLASALTDKVRSNLISANDGTQLFVRDWGSGEPIVFLAGWCLTSDLWAYQMSAMVEKGFRCIAYDRRGHGKSADPGRGYEYDTLADDLATVLEQRNLQQVTLVTHSMASGEAIRYMTRHNGKRVARICMIAPTAPAILQTINNPTGVPREFFEKLREELRDDFHGWIARNTEPFVVPSTSQAMRNWLTGQMTQVSMQAMLECNRIMIEADFRAELKTIKAPILVIHGDADASAPLLLTGKRVAEIAPNTKLKTYEKAPHGLFVTHVRELNADILKFAA